MSRASGRWWRLPTAGARWAVDLDRYALRGGLQGSDRPHPQPGSRGPTTPLDSSSLDIGSFGHAVVLKGHKGDLAIMAGRPTELGIQYVERVTGIEPALSACEAARYGRLGGLTSRFGCPAGTAVDRQSP